VVKGTKGTAGEHHGALEELKDTAFGRDGGRSRPMMGRGGAHNRGSRWRNSTSGLPRGRRRLEDEDTEGGSGGRRRRSSGEAARAGGQRSHEETTAVWKIESAVGARA
jgi:hypothetical protein